MAHDKDHDREDDSVQAALVEVHRNMLRLLTRRLGNADEASDVLQDYYVKVLTLVSDLREENNSGLGCAAYSR